jgi:two-component system chemotaxis response regulator CheB
MARIRVLVVEDSATVRRHVCDVLTTDDDIDVVGEAANGRLAIELCRELRPDLITMDMMLPVMSGLAATEHIMAHFPTPILIVSSSLNRGELFQTYQALAAGAVDVLEKPAGGEADAAWERKLLSAAKLASRIRVITHPRVRLGEYGQPRQRHPAAAPAHPRTQRDYEVIAVGASTGGPGAIVEVLRALPPDFPLPVLLVLHLSEPFGAAFAEWLQSQTRHGVVHAHDGQPVSSAAGRVVMGRSGHHLVVREGRFHLTRDPERHSCRPSVDVLFESVAREYGPRAAACVLTGMGRDGAAGLLEVRSAGGLTIAQDEATSVVYGMPGEAVRVGAVERILPLGDIGPTLALLPGSKLGGQP